MRVLIPTAPGAGFFLGTVPLAWALRAAGHDVLVANNAGGATTLAASGFPVVDLAPGEDVHAEFLRSSSRAGGAPSEGLSIFGRAMADRLLEVATAVEPDLIVSTLEMGAAPIAAAALGVPHVEQSVRLAWPSRSEQAVRYRNTIHERLAPVRERLGVREVPPPAAFIDVAPPSVADTPAPNRWLMRYVPYNEGRVLPPWLLERPTRPRICVTMGTVVGGGAASPLRQMFLDAMYDLLAGLGDLDADIVLAMGENTGGGRPLPENMRHGGWVPLDVLLPTCSAIVHHGGAGTSFAALAAGVPQLVLPRNADQPDNARVLTERGCARSLEPAELSAGAIREELERALTEPGLRKAADEVRAEVVAMPAPADVVRQLARVGGR